MKPSFCIFLLFSLLLLVNVNCARNVPEDYWKKVMKNQEMPEAIKGLIVEDSEAVKKSQFVKDFDTRSVAVIYRARDDQKLNAQRIHD